MAPETPARKGLASQRGADADGDADPETPPSHYFMASEETPTRPGAQIHLEFTPAPSAPLETEDVPGSSSSYESGTSFNDESMMEVDDEEVGDEVLFDEEDAAEETDPGQPLVHSSRRRKRREESRGEGSLLELIPPLILAHPLPYLPMLALLPYNFLPAGVVFFIPVICVLAALSACAHIVIVYLSWYLKVPTFEEISATVSGGRPVGRWAGRAAVVLSVVGMTVHWLGTLHPLLQPAIEVHLPKNAFARSSITWTIVPSLLLLPSLLPSRMTRSLRRAPIVLALLLPVVAFLIIGRTVEIKKAEDGLDRRALGLAGGSSAGAGITTLTMFLSPHLNTLSIHAHLDRNKRASFPIPCLAASVGILVLSLPLALVPYYLLPALPDPLPTTSPITPSGVFARLPAHDAWVNLARCLMAAVSLGTCNMWILRGRDTVLQAMNVDRGERHRAGRWVGFAIWAVIVAFACIGGVVSEKLELMGVIATLTISWFLPALFFIITFHVRSPLAIVFPSRHPPAEVQARRNSHSRANSTADPSMDVLLARKERQLQKRRTGRRLWQDLIVYVGILPVGGMTLLWSFGALVGVW